MKTNIGFKLLTMLAVLSFTALLLACDTMPAAKINPNGTDGDNDGSEDSGDGDESDGDGDGNEADDDGNDTSQLPLDVVLDAEHARAGIVTNPEDELIPGEKAQGAAGDYKIYNNKTAFIIQGGDHTNGWRGVSGSGGTILDAAPLDTNGAAAEDQLIELWPLAEMDALNLGLEYGAYRNFKIEKIELINNGGNGKAAVIKVSGIDWGSPLADRYSKLLSAPPNPQVKLFVYYKLEPDSDHLDMEIRAKQFTEENNLIEVLTLGAGIITDSQQETYYYGYQLEQEPAYLKAYKAPVLARYSYNKTYLLSCGSEEDLQLMKFDERPYFATCENQLKVEKGGTVTNELRFYVSAASPDALLNEINSPQKTQPRAKGRLTLPSPLTISDVIVAAKDFENDRVLSVTYPYEKDSVNFYEFYSLPNSHKFYIAAYSRAGGEGLPTSAIELAVNGYMNDISAISPAAPASAWITVQRNTTAKAESDFMAARLDFYIQGEYDARKKPYFTTFVNAYDMPARVLVPMYGVESQTFAIVASAGLFYSIDVKTNVKLMVQGETAEDGEFETLDFVLKQVVDLGVSQDEPVDGDADAVESEDEAETAEEAESETSEDSEPAELAKSDGELSSVLYVPAAVGLRSDASLDCFTPISESFKAASATHYRAVVYTDADTVTPAATSAELTGYSNTLTTISGMSVKTPKLEDYSQSGYITSAIGVSAPEDSEQYFDIPGFYYSDYDGGFNGVSPPPGAWDAFRSDYSAVLIHQPLLRGNGDDSGMLERYGAYDPHVGKDSIDSLIGDYLAQWNSVSLLSADNDFVYIYKTLADWASLLNQGYTCTATFGNDGDGLAQMGYPVNLLVLSDNTWSGAAGPLSAALKKHRNIIVAGPTVQINIADALPGDTYTPADITGDGASIILHLKVVAPLWVPFNFAMLVQNGQVLWPPKNFNFAGAIQTFEDEGYRIFEQDISIALPLDTAETPLGKYKDFWVTAIALTVPTIPEMDASAEGQNLRETAASYTLFPVYPEAISFGLANPIWVDANGNNSFDAPGVLNADTPYLQNSELCAVIIAHDNQNLTGAREACCAKYPTAIYCNP